MPRLTDNPAAFPRPASEFTKSGTCPDGNDPIDSQDGMSLRDYFAGQVVVGWLAMCADPDVSAAPTSRELAELAYRFADALLKERGAGK